MGEPDFEVASFEEEESEALKVPLEFSFEPMVPLGSHRIFDRFSSHTTAFPDAEVSKVSLLFAIHAYSW